MVQRVARLQLFILAHIMRRFQLVRPDATSTKLVVDEEGLKALESIPGTISPIVVIGPYRSGKSFLLNQLLEVRCAE